VLEALASSMVLELTGELGSVPLRLREDLRRLGQRALLHAGSERGRGEEEDEALELAVELARDGLRALSGRPAEAGEETGAGPEIPTRDLARLVAGTAEPFEAATIARRVRRSPSGRKELGWALRLERSSLAEERGAAEDVAPIQLAAADGEPVRDPAAGRRLAVLQGASGAELAEVYAFADGEIAVYAAAGEPVRLEGQGVRTIALSPGYFCGRVEGERVVGTVLVGDEALPVDLLLA
jgi:hypothetical protein